MKISQLILKFKCFNVYINFGHTITCIYHNYVHLPCMQPKILTYVAFQMHIYIHAHMHTHNATHAK